MNFMILLIYFVICNVSGHLRKNRFSDFHVFQYCENCVSLNAKTFSMFQYLNETKLPIKKKVRINALKVWFGSKEANIGIFCL